MGQSVILVVENTSHVATCEISAASKDQLIFFHRGSDLVLRQPRFASCFGRAGSLELWAWCQGRADQRGVAFVLTAPAAHMDNRIPTAWGYPGVGTPCGCSDCPLSHSQCVLWHHQHTWGSQTCCGGTCASSAPESSGRTLGVLGISWWSWICLELKASLGEARTASGEEILEGRTLDKGRKEGRQKTEISTSGYTRKGPVNKNVPWGCTYCDIKMDMSGEVEIWKKGVDRCPKEKKYWGHTW